MRPSNSITEIHVISCGYLWGVAPRVLYSEVLSLGVHAFTSQPAKIRLRPRFPSNSISHRSGQCRREEAIVVSLVAEACRSSSMRFLCARAENSPPLRSLGVFLVLQRRHVRGVT